MDLTGQKLLRIEYIPLNRVVKWDKNPKKHDLPRLMQSIQRYGFRDAVIFDGTLGSLVAGHGRAASLEAIQNQGDPPPDGVALDAAGVWYIPVQFSNDAESRAVAEAFALDHNNLTVMGSGFDASLLWDAAGYAEVLRGLADGFALPVTVDAETAAGLLGLNGSGNGVEEYEFEPGKQPDLVAPFPYFGGKARVASKIWQRLGEVQNYIEPFCGSAAVLLASPFDLPIVTLNDMDGFICNFWRAVAYAPDEVAKWVDWPVNENDLFARHIWLIRQSGELVQRLETDPDYYDAKIAGWWCWGCCTWIAGGWCSGEGPWTVEGGEVRDQRAGPNGPNREPGTASAERQARRAGVKRQLPHLGNAGRGVNAQRVAGAGRQLPHLGGEFSPGQGINKALWRTDGTCEAITAHLHAYMQTLSAKLRRARVCCGDWLRVCGSETTTTGHGLTGVLLDPPYSAEAGRDNTLYSKEDLAAAHRVREWCVTQGDNPLMRIALCGYDVEHTALEAHGWSAMRWNAGTGYSGKGQDKKNRFREVIWFSPHCLGGG